MRHRNGSKSAHKDALSQIGKFFLINTTLLSLFSAASPALLLPVQASPLAPTTESKPGEAQAQTAGAGSLLAMTSAGKPLGQCALKHTSVSTKIAGYVAKVTVKQSFTNPYKDKIEAIYTFPLSESGAVDSMTMKVGNRIIKGSIKKREEAKQIYENAKAQGHVASLLDQERTNIFTQSVANIESGANIDITITYVELLKYDASKFSYTFPTVVGPRFIPGDATGKEGTGWAPDTTTVADASKITPPVTQANTRAGHDISIDVDVDAGVPIQNISSKLHEINVTKVGNDEAKVSLKDKETIPNKDFVLSWDVAGDALKSGYLTHRDSKTESGYFTLMLLPPKRVTVDKIAPKEMIFLIDCSGSQRGAPLDKAKETLRYIVDHMNPQDSFQIIAFSQQQKLLFENKAQQVTGARKIQANQFIDELQANGGTWMGPAVERACSIPADEHRLRIVTFMTDGYVGNDLEILGLIKKNRSTSRWFSFGTGNSVNHMLIDGIAAEGGGEADYVLLNTSGAEVGKKFYDRISSPVLTDVSVDFGKLEVKEVFPKDVSDVWAEKPLYIKGRYLKPGAGTITLKGFSAGKPYSQTLAVNFPELNQNNEVLGSIWARAKVDRLQSEDYQGAQRGNINKEIKDEIIQTALEHHIMTNYTSFVAVEEKTVTKDGVVKTVTVPVELPDGVSREGVFGEPMPSSPMPQQAFGGAYMNSKGLSPSARYSMAPMKAYNNYAPGGGYAKMAPFVRPVGGGGGSGAGSYGEGSSGAPMSSTTRVSGVLGQKTPNEESKSGKTREVQVLSDSLKESKKEDSDKTADKPGKIPTNVPSNLDKELQKLLGAKLAGKALPAMKCSDGTFVNITVKLSDVTEEILKKLKDAGFELKSKGKARVTGRIRIESLKKLCELTAVEWVKPAQD
ncbi:MAG: VWA domain-containing protein [Cyanobacteria bacterium SZAS-4]|nr:VWA domain-containing protein [Cyanobacteria bacterium SZAS-4]